MVKIRLKKMGRKKNPVYKIVVAEAMSKRDGRVADILGTYNPKTKEVQLDRDKLEDWLSKGAQLTDRVRAIVKSAQ